MFGCAYLLSNLAAKSICEDPRTSLNGKKQRVWALLVAQITIFFALSIFVGLAFPER